MLYLIALAFGVVTPLPTEPGEHWIPEVNDDSPGKGARPASGDRCSLTLCWEAVVKEVQDPCPKVGRVIRFLVWDAASLDAIDLVNA